MRKWLLKKVFHKWLENHWEVGKEDMRSYGYALFKDGKRIHPKHLIDKDLIK